MSYSQGDGFRSQPELYSAMFEVTVKYSKYPRSKVLRQYLQGSMYNQIYLQNTEHAGINMGIRESHNDPIPYLSSLVAQIGKSIERKEDWFSFLEYWVLESAMDPCYFGDDCCTGYPTMPAEGDSPKCEIFENFKHEFTCCNGRLAVQYCMLCRARFCDECSIQHHGHKRRAAVCPCPQMLISQGEQGSADIEYLTPSTFQTCYKCRKTTCNLCTNRYKCMMIVENLPPSWSDGQIIEALEVSLNSPIVRCDRICSHPRLGQMYVQFRDQSIRLRTQCLKLTDRGSNATIQVKPSRSGKEVKADQKVVPTGIVVSATNINLFETLTSMLREVQLQPVDVLYAWVIDDSDNATKIGIRFTDNRCNGHLTLTSLRLTGSVLAHGTLLNDPTDRIDAKGQQEFFESLMSAYWGNSWTKEAIIPFTSITSGHHPHYRRAVELPVPIESLNSGELVKFEHRIQMKSLRAQLEQCRDFKSQRDVVQSMLQQQKWFLQRCDDDDEPPPLALQEQQQQQSKLPSVQPPTSRPTVQPAIHPERQFQNKSLDILNSTIAAKEAEQMSEEHEELIALRKRKDVIVTSLQVQQMIEGLEAAIQKKAAEPQTPQQQRELAEHQFRYNYIKQFRHYGSRELGDEMRKTGASIKVIQSRQTPMNDLVRTELASLKQKLLILFQMQGSDFLLQELNTVAAEIHKISIMENNPQKQKLLDVYQRSFNSCASLLHRKGSLKPVLRSLAPTIQQFRPSDASFEELALMFKYNLIDSFIQSNEPSQQVVQQIPGSNDAGLDDELPPLGNTDIEEEFLPRLMSEESTSPHRPMLNMGMDGLSPLLAMSSDPDEDYLMPPLDAADDTADGLMPLLGEPDPEEDPVAVSPQPSPQQQPQPQPPQSELDIVNSMIQMKQNDDSVKGKRLLQLLQKRHAELNNDSITKEEEPPPLGLVPSDEEGIEEIHISQQTTKLLSLVSLVEKTKSEPTSAQQQQQLRSLFKEIALLSNWKYDYAAVLSDAEKADATKVELRSIKEALKTASGKRANVLRMKEETLKEVEKQQQSDIKNTQLVIHSKGQQSRSKEPTGPACNEYIDELSAAINFEIEKLIAKFKVTDRKRDTNDLFSLKVKLTSLISLQKKQSRLHTVLREQHIVSSAAELKQKEIEAGYNPSILKELSSLQSRHASLMEAEKDTQKAEYIRNNFETSLNKKLRDVEIVILKKFSELQSTREKEILSIASECEAAVKELQAAAGGDFETLMAKYESFLERRDERQAEHTRKVNGITELKYKHQLSIISEMYQTLQESLQAVKPITDNLQYCSESLPTYTSATKNTPSVPQTNSQVPATDMKTDKPPAGSQVPGAKVQPTEVEVPAVEKDKPSLVSGQPNNAHQKSDDIPAKVPSSERVLVKDQSSEVPAVTNDQPSASRMMNQYQQPTPVQFWPQVATPFVVPLRTPIRIEAPPNSNRVPWLTEVRAYPDHIYEIDGDVISWPSDDDNDQSSNIQPFDSEPEGNETPVANTKLDDIGLRNLQRSLGGNFGIFSVATVATQTDISCLLDDAERKKTTRKKDT
eukprot:TRINITY_DN2035_c2_g2_i1.p1 TRINITY_DN2035_c2_g2~~TRINITY_DN2035_c2_g2_i1.p1  ORF type:complete len:1549 (+),score=290.03 TRINITY_DN2035_c2_g2_i1:187-4833(+)